MVKYRCKFDRTNIGIQGCGAEKSGIEGKIQKKKKRIPQLTENQANNMFRKGGGQKQSCIRPETG